MAGEKEPEVESSYARRRRLRQRVSSKVHNGDELLTNKEGEVLEDLRIATKEGGRKIFSRNEQFLEWIKEKRKVIKRRAASEFELQLHSGKNLIDQYQEGAKLFQGTKTELDPLQTEYQNSRAESDWLEKAREVLAGNEQIKEAIDSATLERRETEEEHFQTVEKLPYIKKENFRQLVLQSHGKAKKAKEIAQKAAAEAFTVFETLRRQAKLMSFDARARTRRKLLSLQDEAKAREAEADVAIKEAARLKEHVMNHGFRPDLYVSVLEEQKLLERLSKSGSEKSEATLRLPTLPASKVQEPRKPKAVVSSNNTKNEEPEVDKGKPEEEEEILTEWQQQVREGLFLTQLERMDRAKYKGEIRSKVESEQRAFEQRELTKMSKELSKHTEKKDKQEDTVATVDWEPEVDFTVLSLSVPNLTKQEVGTETSKELTYVARGMTKDTAPKLCVQWALNCCSRVREKCPKRHFFISEQEKILWAENRETLDSKAETKVIENITQRESLIDAIKEEMINSQKRFDSHFFDKVQLSDVAPLLHLLNQLRSATVLTIESIVAWRDIVSKQFSNTHSGNNENIVYKDRSSGWVVKISSIGKQLYPGSTAYKSKVKRFCRDEDVDGKKETNFEYVGVYDTQVEALQVYDKIIQARATKNHTTADRLPLPRTIVRSCGKHFCIESDVGLPNTRCEICHAASFDGLISFTPAYLWNGQNYLLKILRDSDFLNESVPLSKFFVDSQAEFPLLENPFMLTKSLAVLDDDEPIVIPISQPGENYAPDKDENAKQVARNFGRPSNSCLIYDNGCIEWFGHMSYSTKVKIGKTLAYVSRLVVDQNLVREFAEKHSNMSAEVLDMKRVRIAKKILMEEERLGRYMYTRRQEIKKEKLSLKIQKEKDERRRDRERRRNEGEKVDSDSDYSSGEDTPEETMDEEEISKKYGLRYLTEAEVQLNGDDYSWLFRTLPDAAEEERKKWPAGERLQKNRIHTVYYWDRGEYIALQQTRHERTGFEEGIWCSSAPGCRWEGMAVKGEHMKHFNFEEDLKRKGEELQRRRKMLQMYLKVEMWKRDKCHPDIIRFLISTAHDLGGSILLLDCKVAETFLKRWKERTKAAICIERVLRGRFAREFCRRRRQRIAKRAVQLRQFERQCVVKSRTFVKSIMNQSVSRARKRLKKPDAVIRTVLDGEPVTLIVHDTSRCNRYTRVKSLPMETCFACLQMRSRMRIRRDLTWLCVRGRACQGNQYNAWQGIVRLKHVFELKKTGPCYCRRELPKQDMLHIRAYNSITCDTYSLTVPLDKLLKTLFKQNFNDSKTKIKEIESYVATVDLRILQNGLFFRDQHRSKLKCLEANTDSASGSRLCKSVFSISWKLESIFSYLNMQREAMKKHIDSLSCKAQALDKELMFRANVHEVANQQFLDSHFTLLATKTHNDCMIKATENAMLFSTRQIKLFNDLELSSNVQAWDPLEEANNAIFIQRKWQSRKAVKLAESLRSDSLEKLFNTQQFLNFYEYQAGECRRIRDMFKTILNDKLTVYLKNVESSLNAIRIAKSLLTRHVLGSLNLRLKNGAPRVARALIYGRKFKQWNVLYRRAKQVQTAKFLEMPIVIRRYVISVLEDASEANSFAKPPLPPFWKQSIFTWTDTETRMRAFDPMASIIQNGFISNRKEVISLDKALGMLVRCRSGDGIKQLNNSVQGKWSQQYKIEDAVSQPPFLGTIRIECIDTKTSTVKHWIIDPIELRELLLDPHVGKPGEAIPYVFSYKYVHKLMNSVPKSHQKWREVLRTIRLKVVARLLELIHIGTFDSLLKLGKLQFFRLRRSLFKELFQTQWWKDMQNGRSVLKGTEIYRGGRKVGGGYCVVAVFENHGDLTFELCWPFRGPKLRSISSCSKDILHNNDKSQFYSIDHKSSSRILVTETSIRESLQESPKLLVFWTKSVECCRYSPKLIRAILNKICVADPLFKTVKETLLHRKSFVKTSSNKSRAKKGAAYSNISSQELYGEIKFPPKPGFSDIDDPCKSTEVASKNDTVLALAQNSSKLFELVHREVVTISDYACLASAFCNPRGDVLITVERRPMVYKDCDLRINLSFAQIRSIVSILSWPNKFLRSEDASCRKQLSSHLFSLLAIRVAIAPQPIIRQHPIFTKYCRMLQYGVPRGAVQQSIMLHCSNPDKIIPIVLEKDHNSVPPKEYYLPDREIDVLVLSNLAPEEHFQVLLRESAVTANPGHEVIPFHLEVLKRFNNLWIRIRRETNREKRCRLEGEERKIMTEEDMKSNEMNVKCEKEISYQTRLNEITKAALLLVESLRITFEGPNCEIYTPTYRLMKANQQCWLFSKELLKKNVRIQEQEVTILVRAKLSLGGRVLIGISNSSSQLASYIADLESSMGEPYQMAIAKFSRCFKKNMDGSICFDDEQASMKLYRCYCYEKSQKAHAHWNILRRAIFVEGKRIFIQVFHSAAGYDTIKFSCVEAQCFFFCRTTSPCPKCFLGIDLGEQKTLPKEEKMPCASSLGYEKNDEGAHHSNTNIKKIQKKKFEPRKHRRRISPWREARMAWMKLNRFCSSKPNNDQSLTELFDTDRVVGKGPERGGAKAYEDPMETKNVGLLTKRSILIDAVSLDVLTGGSTVITDTKKLTKWLCSGIRIRHGNDEFGKDDLVSFNWEFFRGNEINGGIKNDRYHALNIPGYSINASLTSEGGKGQSQLMITLVDSNECRQTDMLISKPRVFQLHSPNSWKLKSLEYQNPFFPYFHGKVNDSISTKVNDSLDPRKLSRLFAEISDSNLIVRKRGADLVFADFNEWWVREQDRKVSMRILMLARQTRSYQGTVAAIDRYLDQCRYARIIDYYRTLSNHRIKVERVSIRTATLEWSNMFAEDTYASKIRPYLTATPEELLDIKESFDLYDKDKSGSISVKEFQATVFEIGELMTAEEVEKAVQEIDRDNSGDIDFEEFAIWWLCPRDDAQLGNKTSNFDMRKLKAKLELYRQLRKAKRGIEQSVSLISNTVEEKGKRLASKPIK